MVDVANSLRIKYGLESNPTQSEIDDWASATEKLIEAGVEEEYAGREAAARVFRSFETYIFKSQTDNILALLRAAKNKQVIFRYGSRYLF